LPTFANELQILNSIILQNGNGSRTQTSVQDTSPNPCSPVITKVEAWIVQVPFLKEWVTSEAYGTQPDQPRVIVRIETEDETYGWGEGVLFWPRALVQSAAQRLVGRHLDELRICLLPLHEKGASYWEHPHPPSPYAARLENLQHRVRHPMQTIFEMALCDLQSRAANLSLSSFLGGRWRSRIASDYWIPRMLPEEASLCAARGKSLGFTGLKMKATLEDDNVQRLEAIHRECGADFHLTVDPNGRFYRLDDALPTIRRMERVGNLTTLEDPFPRAALCESKALRARTDVRIVLHIDPPESLASVISSGAAGGLNLDSHNSGIHRWLRMAAAADAANLPVWHGSGLDLGIYTAAQLHLAAAAPNCQLPGDHAGPWLRESDLLMNSLKIENGGITVPSGPGLGIEVDMAALDRYTTGYFSVPLP